MKQPKVEYRDIDEYIAAYSGDAADMLSKLRAIVHDAVPDINEKISWQMPTFYKKGIIIQFAAHQAHIGVYPGPDAINVFKEQIAEYKYTKGGFQLPYGKPLPHDLLRSLVLFRLAEEERRALEKAKTERKKKK